jgi:protein involved in sex pheromone biosynthesis
MKKLLSIALIAATFILVGCTAEKPGSTMMRDTGFTKHKEPCKGPSCYGKLGMEKNTGDIRK